MDRKSILVITACFALMWVVSFVVPKIFPPIPVPISTNQVEAVALTNAPGSLLASNGVVAQKAAVIATNSAVASTLQLAPVTHSTLPAELLTITNDRSRYVFTSRGGGLQEVELLGYPETVSARRQKAHPTNDLATLNTTEALPVFALVGDQALQGDDNFKLTAVPGGLRAEKVLANGITIVKEFQFSTNYLMSVAVRVENHNTQAVQLPAQEWVSGAATPMGPMDNGYAESVVWYNGAKTANVTLPYFNTNTSSVFGLMSRTPLTQYLMGNNDVGWVSAQNQFFTLAVIPGKPAQSVLVHMFPLPGPTMEELHENPLAIRAPHGLQSALIYPAQVVQAGQAWTNQFYLFAGPKEYQTLAHLAARFNNDIDLAMNFGWFGAVSKSLLLAMNWIHHSLGLPYGAVIIVITVVIKFIFWPLTKASVRSAKRMAALQPQLKALQEKYKDDPQKFTAKQWEFYKKNKVNPLSGCLPMLLQVPVFIGFYGMLRTAIELRGATFLWMGDLSKPDTVVSLTLPFHYLGFSDAFFPINPMPILMGFTLLWQASMTPPSPSMDASQQKIMKFMPLMMLFFMYSQPSGLALYWTVSNLLTVLQTKLTRSEPDPVTDVKATVVSVSPAPLAKKKK